MIKKSLSFELATQGVKNRRLKSRKPFKGRLKPDCFRGRLSKVNGSNPSEALEWKRVLEIELGKSGFCAREIQLFFQQWYPLTLILLNTTENGRNRWVPVVWLKVADAKLSVEIPWGPHRVATTWIQTHDLSPTTQLCIDSSNSNASRRKRWRG